MKQNILFLSIITVLTTYKLNASENFINIHPNLSQHIFTKNIKEDNILTLPETFLDNYYYFEDENKKNLKNITFKPKTNINFSNIKEGTDIIIDSGTYQFLKFTNNLIYLKKDNNIVIKNPTKIESITIPDLILNEHSSFIFNNKNLNTIKGTYLFSGLQWNEAYYLNVNLDTFNGNFNSYININNNTDIDYNNIDLRLLYSHLNVNQHRKSNVIRDIPIDAARSFSEESANMMLSAPQEMNIANKKTISLNNVSLKSKQKEIIHFTDNLNFNFELNYHYFISNNYIQEEKLSYTIKPTYSLKIERNNENEKLFDLENNNIIVYDDNTKNIINISNVSPEKSNHLNINLGESDINALKLNYHHGHYFKDSFMNGLDKHKYKVNFYASMKHFEISDILKHDNVKNNISLNHNQFLLSKKIDHDTLKKLFDALQVNQAFYEETFNKEIKPFIIDEKDYFNSDTYKNKVFILLSVNY